MDTTAYGAIVLAGGGARRMGGVSKPDVRVGGVRMIDRVLAAVAPAGTPIVVGPSELALPSGVAVTREVPPGGGPAAAVAAAFAASPGRLAPLVAIVAGDLPLLTPGAVRALLAAAGQSSVDGTPYDGAVYVDADGRPQWLCGVWRSAALAGRIATLAAERAADPGGRADPGSRADRGGRVAPGGERAANLGGRADRDGESAGGRDGLAGLGGERVADRDRLVGAGGERAGRRPAGLAGVALRDLFGPLRFARLPAEVAADHEGTVPLEDRGQRIDDHGVIGTYAERPPPWFDCDTEEDIRRAEEWLIR